MIEARDPGAGPLKPIEDAPEPFEPEFRIGALGQERLGQDPGQAVETGRAGVEAARPGGAAAVRCQASALK